MRLGQNENPLSDAGARALSVLDSVSKSQQVRLFDVYALGPLLIYAGVKGATGKWVRRALFTSGVFTVLYNFRNYVNIRAEIQKRIAEGEVS